MALKPSALAVLALLRSKPEGVTALDALDEVGSFRLGARVFELKEAGYVIETCWVETHNHKRIASYRLHEREQLALAL